MTDCRKSVIVHYASWGVYLVAMFNCDFYALVVNRGFLV